MKERSTKILENFGTEKVCSDVVQDHKLLTFVFKHMSEGSIYL